MSLHEGGGRLAGRKGTRVSLVLPLEGVGRRGCLLGAVFLAVFGVKRTWEEAGEPNSRQRRTKLSTATRLSNSAICRST